MKYRLRALKAGECRVRNYITYSDVWDEDTSDFYLYVWLVEGGERPTVIDTGPKDVESFNRATQQYIPGGIVQTPDERTPALIGSAGIDANDVSHVIVTHLHGDHCDYFDAFGSAQLVANRGGFLESVPGGIPKPLICALAARWPASLRLVDEEEVVPGIRVFPLGLHSSCSQAVAVDTENGTAVLVGDVAYLYRNLEEDIPIRGVDEEEWRAAIERVKREGQIVLPGHDPLVMQRFPGGVIA